MASLPFIPSFCWFGPFLPKTTSFDELIGFLYFIDAQLVDLPLFQRRATRQGASQMCNTPGHLTDVQLTRARHRCATHQGATDVEHTRVPHRGCDALHEL